MEVVLRRWKSFALLGVHFLFAISLTWLVAGSAESSREFKVDQQATLEGLRRQIESTDTSVGPQSAEQSSREASPAALERGEGASSATNVREITETVKPGDTLELILRRLGVSDGDVTYWSAASKLHPSLARLEPEHDLVFLLPRGTDRVAGLQYEMAPDAVLVMRKEGRTIAGHVERSPFQPTVRIVSGVIESSLYAAAKREGVPDSVISSLVDIFGWDVDFRSDLRRGDTFRISYEAPDSSANPKLRSQRIIAAELNVRGKVWRAVYFEAEDDGGRYYSSEGRPYGRAFLRYPLEFSRISSVFTDARMHPILRTVRPHLGVDFAAPIGTPIRAIGAGKIVMARWDGGFGRTVRIDHGFGLSSQYSHMNAFAPDIHEGARVEMGHAIGTVGVTGLATGPHCHFALWRAGAYVNPLTAKLPASAPLDRRFQAQFIRARDEQLAELSGDARVYSVASRAHGE